MIFGLAGWNMDFDPVAAAGKAVQTAASDFFTGVANWFDDVKKFWNSITPSGAAKAIIKGILKPLPMGAGDKIADIYLVTLLVLMDLHSVTVLVMKLRGLLIKLA